MGAGETAHQACPRAGVPVLMRGVQAVRATGNAPTAPCLLVESAPPWLREPLGGKRAAGGGRRRGGCLGGEGSIFLAGFGRKGVLSSPRIGESGGGLEGEEGASCR